MNLTKGRVVKSTGSWYRIEIGNHNFIDARLKGKFRISGLNTTNPIAVGDWVDVQTLGNEVLITKLYNRENYLIRKSTKLSKQRHILASNITQLIIIVTIENPYTSFEFVDRIICTSEAYHIPIVLVFNKVDLIAKDNQKLKVFKNLYENLGYLCIETSALNGYNLNAFKRLLENKTSLITGHSGCGKSSLINAVDSNLQLKTSAISEAFKTGKHTTTFAEMFPLSFGGYVIDTPGVKAFGVIEIEPAELSHYFIEMRNLLPNCKFNNCMHIDEPKCAVKQGVLDGKIAETRYKSYMSILQEDEEHYRIGP